MCISVNNLPNDWQRPAWPPSFYCQMWQYEQRRTLVLIHFLDSRPFWHTDYSWFNIHSPKQLAMIRNEWKQKLTLLLKYRIFVRNIKIWKITYKHIMMMVSSRYIRSICMMTMARKKWHWLQNQDKNHNVTINWWEQPICFQSGMTFMQFSFWNELFSW